MHRRNLQGTRGTSAPTFWTEGYSTPHFSGRKGEEFAAVNRGDLRRLSYNKTIFGRGSERAHDALPEPRVR